MQNRWLRIAGMFLLAALVAVAADAREFKSEPGPIRLFGNIGVYYTEIKPGAAELGGIGTKGGGMVLSGDIAFWGILTAGMEYDVLLVPDRDSFTNMTNRGPRESDTYALGFSVCAGLNTPGLKLHSNGTRLRLGVNIGHSWFGGSRSIVECYGCDSESFEIDGGNYYEPLIAIGKPLGFEVTASVRFYQGAASMQNAYIVRFGRAF